MPFVGMAVESVKTALKVLEAVVETPLVGISEPARRLNEPKTTIPALPDDAS